MNLVSERRAFTNPVYSEPFADPFCWQHGGTYYAVGTGRFEENGLTGDHMVIPLVKSSDMQSWESLGNVVHCPVEERGGSFWAPEVAHEDGRFYLYYHPNGSSNGNQFHIRVAVSDYPEGPYFDTGQPMTDKESIDFAIDSHAFRDDDGQWYMFFATDFLDFDRTTFRGTALAVDKMVSMTELEGNPKVVMRAHWDWQCFQRSRDWKGAVENWYTLEGPTVVKRGGRYYCFYSGGCWENDTYGVDYLVADSIMGPWTEVGRERGPQLMRTIPGRVIGPGHHSIVTSPDGREDFVVYHAWNEDRTHRLMWVDPLIWTPDGPIVERFKDYVELASNARLTRSASRLRAGEVGIGADRVAAIIENI